MSAGTWATTGQLVGLLLASYGLIRENFERLAEERPFGEGRYGEGPYGGGVSAPTRALLSFATWARLLPGDKVLTSTDRKRNAALAVAGVGLGALSLGLELALAITKRV